METTPASTGTTYGVPSRRKEITERLSEAYSRDMLDQREFESRLERAEAARTVEELEALVADFDMDSREARGAASRVVTILSDQTHIVTPADSEGLHSFSILGDVKIDLRAFRGSGRSLTVRVSGALGDVGIRVPAGTRVVRRCRIILGEFRHVLEKKPGQVRQLWDRLFGTQERVPPSTFPPDGRPPTLILEGIRVLGDVTIEESAP